MTHHFQFFFIIQTLIHCDPFMSYGFFLVFQELIISRLLFLLKESYSQVKISKHLFLIAMSFNQIMSSTTMRYHLMDF